MQLSDFFQHLAYGELSQYSVGSSNHGEISEKDYPKLLTFLNLGLTRLHTALPLRMEQLLLRTNAFQRTYKLVSSNAVSTATDSDNVELRYILDSQRPFQDNILRVEEIVNEDEIEYPLNDHSCDTSVFTPLVNELQFTNPQDELVSVMYRANHVKLPVTRIIDTTTNLDIPDYCIDALLTYCASKVLGGGGNAEAAQEGLMLMQLFEAKLDALEDAGVITTDIPTRTRIWSEGWA